MNVRNREVSGNRPRPKPTFFYGWVVVAACFAATLCTGEVVWSFGVFFTSLEQEFGWSRHLVSSGYTLLIVGHSVSAIIGGRLADRGAARPTLLGSALLGGVAIMLCSQIETLPQFRALFLAAGLGAGASHSIPNSVVQRWFANRAHAGIALATVMAGIGIGALLFAPLFRYLIASSGWRPTLIFAGAAFFTMVGLSGALKRPYARGKASAAGLPLGVRKPGQKPTTARRVFLTRQFLTLLGVNFVAFLAFQVTIVHLVPYASDAGVSPSVAAVALGLTGAASVPGRFVSGVLAERLGWVRTLAVALLGGAVAMAGLMVVAQNWMLIGAVALFGLCHGMRAVAVMGLLGRFFGTVVLGELIGVTIAIGQLMSAPGPYLAGYWFDLGNSYNLTFALLAVALILGALLVLTLCGGDGPTYWTGRSRSA